MTKISLFSISIAISLLTACGGGSSTPSSSSSSGSSTGGSSTGGSSTGGSSTGGSSTGGSSTGGSSTGGSSTGGSSTGGSSTGGSSPTTKVIYNRTMTYPVLDRTATMTIKVTEFHQNDDNATNYNLWDYNYSPTKDTYRIFSDSYYKTVSPPSVVSEEFFQQNSEEQLIEIDPRSPFINSLQKRKITTTHYDSSGNATLSGIDYDSIHAYHFDNSPEQKLIGIDFRSEVEDLVTNQDWCSHDKISKGDILIDTIGQGFWQIGDKITIEIDSDSFVIGCDEQDIPSIISPIQTYSIGVSTLTGMMSQLNIRNKQFNDVLEFTDTNSSTNVGADQIITSSTGKTYLQYYTGKIATTDKDCIGGLNDPNALCTTTDEVANNVPAIPEL